MEHELTFVGSCPAAVPSVARRDGCQTATRPAFGLRRTRLRAAAPPPPPPDEEQQQQPAEEAAEDPAGGDEAEGDENPSAESAADILSSPVFLKKSLEITKKELADAKTALEAAEETLETEKATYLRLAADFENFRRRSANETAELEAKVSARVLKDFLTVLDNFELAEKNLVVETDREKSINSSYQAISKQMVASFTKMGVEPVESEGQTFDPAFMEAITTAQSTELKEGVVVSQMQRGYKIKELCIRPAMCVVSAGPGPEEDEVADEQTAEEDSGEGSASTDEGESGETSENKESK